LTARKSRATKNVNPIAARCGRNREGSLVGQGDQQEPSASGPFCKTGRRRVRKGPIRYLRALAGDTTGAFALQRYTHLYDASAQRHADAMRDMLTNEPKPSVVCEWRK
jgi:hypothetical protein